MIEPDTKYRTLKFTAVVMVLTFTGIAAGANLKIPGTSGSLKVDGRLDEPLWRDAHRVSLNSPDFGGAFPAGGDARIAVCGVHLCLAARLPEMGRIVAMSQGRSPSWWREDQVIWTF